MIQSTVDRLGTLATANELWVITNDLLSEAIAEQLQTMLGEQIICEPAARNTAPAAGLAAFLIERCAPDAVLGIFPADHVITDEEKYRATLEQGIALAAEGENIVVLGVKPVRPETGYGYIETGEVCLTGSSACADLPRSLIGTGQKSLCSPADTTGIAAFFCGARTLANAIREHLSETAPYLQQIADAYGTPRFEQVFRELYPSCENISIDYAVLEPRSAKGEHHSNIYCLPAEFGWNDLGSWDPSTNTNWRRATRRDGNVTEARGLVGIDARNNYVYSPEKFVALGRGR